MEEYEPYWDERLFGHGIQAISWVGADAADRAPKWIGIIFGADEGDRLTIEEKLIPNAEETEYRTITVTDELAARGVRDIWVNLFRDPPVHSDIYIAIDGENEPLKVVKRY